MTDDQEMDHEAVRRLTQASHEGIRLINQHYKNWYDRYGPDQATHMLGTLIASIAASPAVGTDDPQQWIAQVKEYIDLYYNQYLEREVRDRQEKGENEH